MNWEYFAIGFCAAMKKISLNCQHGKDPDDCAVCADKDERPVWKGKPHPGSRWHRPNSRGYGFVINHPAETRHVIDRTLGGDVIYVSGRLTRHAYRQQCTLDDWLEWQHDAKQEHRV